MKRAIHVLNASSRTDTGITENLAESLAWAELPGLPSVLCVTLPDGPNGISNARDSDNAAPAILRYIAREAERSEAIGFVVACFSDPGVHAARELTSKPVVGIGEAGFATALALGDRIGTIGVGSDRGRKTCRIARQAGLSSRVCGHRGLSLDYAQLQNPDLVTERLITAGLALREQDEASVLLFSGAGLARYVAPLQAEVGLPVVDPTQAAFGLVLVQVMQLQGQCP